MESSLASVSQSMIFHDTGIDTRLQYPALDGGRPFRLERQPFEKVCAPAQVFHAVPETFFSALRNSARQINSSNICYWPSFGSLYVPCVLRQSSRPQERFPSKNVSGRLNLRGRFSLSEWLTVENMPAKAIGRARGGRGRRHGGRHRPQTCCRRFRHRAAATNP